MDAAETPDTAVIVWPALARAAPRTAPTRPAETTPTERRAGRLTGYTSNASSHSCVAPHLVPVPHTAAGTRRRRERSSPHSGVRALVTSFTCTGAQLDGSASASGGSS